MASGTMDAFRWALLRLHALRVALDPGTRAWNAQTDGDFASGEAARRSLDGPAIARMIDERRLVER